MRLPTEQLWSVLLALRAIGDWDRSRFVAAQMLLQSEADQDFASRRMRMAAQIFLAEALSKDPENQTDLVRAEHLYNDSLEVSRALAKELDTPEARRDVSVSLNNVANAARAKGDLAAAERLFAESLDISRALAKELDTPEARRDVSVSLNNVANAARAKGDLAAAERLFAESLDIRRALAKELDTPEARRDGFVSLNNIGDLRLVQDDYAGALAIYQEALTTISDLAKSFPSVIEFQRDAALVGSRVGVAEAALGQFDEAKRQLTLASTTIDHLIAVSPSDPELPHIRAMIAAQLEWLKAERS